MLRSDNRQDGLVIGLDWNGREICVEPLFAVERMTGDHTADANYELDRMAELLLEVTIVRFEDAIFDADR